MKIELDVPDFLIDDGQAIRIFSGIELIAKKFKDQSWKIKIVRCNFCGECCTLAVSGTKGIDLKTGYCKHLIESEKPNKKICELGASRPFSCCAYAAGEDDKEQGERGKRNGFGHYVLGGDSDFVACLQVPGQGGNYD